MSDDPLWLIKNEIQSRKDQIDRIKKRMEAEKSQILTEIENAKEENAQIKKMIELQHKDVIHDITKDFETSKSILKDQMNQKIEYYNKMSVDESEINLELAQLENQIKFVEDEEKEKIEMKDFETQSELVPINESVENMKYRIENLKAAIHESRKSNTQKLPKITHPKSYQQKMKQFNEEIHISTTNFETRIKKMEERENRLIEILQFENNKIKKATEAERERKEILENQIDQSKETFEESMSSAKTEFSKLSKVKSPTSSIKKLLKIDAQIDYFVASNNDAKQKLSKLKLEMKRLQKSNKSLQFQLKKKRFGMTQFDTDIYVPE